MYGAVLSKAYWSIIIFIGKGQNIWLTLAAIYTVSCVSFQRFSFCGLKLK